MDMPRRTTQKLGDCYEAAGKYILAHPSDGLRLVHAEVMGQGSIAGTTFGHAFVLDGDTVIDTSNGRNIRLPSVIYFALGHINDIDNFFIYDENEMRSKIIKSQHWGPWDLVTESGL